MQLAIPVSRAAAASAGVPLSRQIYAGLRGAILAGTLRPGDRLPSTRDLAEQLRVSRTVVLLAYDQLLAEGFVRGRGGSGTYVAEGLAAARPKTAREPAKLRLSRFGAHAQHTATDFPEKRLPYDFSYRRSPVEGFPLDAWQRILLRRARKASVAKHEYGPPAGSIALREAIAGHLRRSRAVVCDASQIVIVNGSQQALDLVARVLLDRGDRVAIEDPHYQGAREVFLAAGAQLQPVAVDADGLDPDRLPARARLAFVTPSHQFPTGTILPLARRFALLEWARRANAAVIEDDYDGELFYENQPVASMQGLDTDGRVIYVGTFSRTVYPALRIGYLIAPASLVEAFTAAKWLCDRGTLTLEQETLAEFIASGAYERHLHKARRENARRRAALLEAIDDSLRDRVTITGDRSGTHLVLWPRSRASEETLIADAAAAGVGVYGISRYAIRPRAPGLMLGYSRMSPEDIREGIRRLAHVLP
ncbi:MAG TPA: PLP-dependent aminotransferase family protein [Thermoanaerobaculia bacterium]|nr:PLP-dependent aminotransferase family protein [Thermoanaerobaculia bacterium]